MLVADEAVEIRVSRRQGKRIREIGRMLGASRNTVRRCPCGQGPLHYEREARARRSAEIATRSVAWASRGTLEVRQIDEALSIPARDRVVDDFPEALVL
jgi:transposase